MSTYYNPYNTPLTQSQMETNAIWLYERLSSSGWTLNAICGALGNWESECTLNPNDPQYASYYPSGNRPDGAGGFGLAQWTPYTTKLHWYCQRQGIVPSASDSNPAGTMEIQLAYHEYECTYGLQGDSGRKTWYSNNGYSYSWSAYKASNDDVEELAAAYYWQYERSAAGSTGSRPSQARKWYNFLKNYIGGGSNPDPDVPTPDPDPDPPIPIDYNIIDEAQWGRTFSYPYEGNSDAEKRTYDAVTVMLARFNKALAVNNNYDNANCLKYEVGGFGSNGYDSGTFVIDAFDKAGFPVKQNGATNRDNLITGFRRSGFELLSTSNTVARQGDIVFYQTDAPVYPELNKVYNYCLVLSKESGIYNGTEWRTHYFLGYVVHDGFNDGNDNVMLGVFTGELGAGDSPYAIASPFKNILRFKQDGYDDTLKDKKLFKLLLYACGSDII